MQVPTGSDPVFIDALSFERRDPRNLTWLAYAQFMRNYYRQQLDWSMGVFNLWNHVEFRNGSDLEKNLAFDGLAFHQMRPQLQFDTHLYQRPLKRASFWPDLHPDWLEYDQTFKAKNLPCPLEH